MSRKLTAELANAIIYAWCKDWSIGKMLHYLDCGEDNKKRTNQEWSDLTTKYGFSTHKRLSQPVRAWVANYYSKANNLMWDDNFVLARKLLLSGKDTVSTKSPITEAFKSFKEDDAYITIRSRELDKRHDWNTVK